MSLCLCQQQPAGYFQESLAPTCERGTHPARRGVARQGLHLMTGAKLADGMSVAPGIAGSQIPDALLRRPSLRVQATRGSRIWIPTSAARIITTTAKKTAKFRFILTPTK